MSRPEFSTDLIGRLKLFNGGIPMAMERVWWVQDEMGGDDELGWSRSKIPVFESGGGEYFLVDCDASNAEFGQVIFFNPGSVDYEVTITIYDSLVTLFHSVLTAYEEELFRVGDNGFLEVSDYKKLSLLKKEFNPKSGYWKLYDWK